MGLEASGEDLSLFVGSGGVQEILEGFLEDRIRQIERYLESTSESTSESASASGLLEGIEENDWSILDRKYSGHDSFVDTL